MAKMYPAKFISGPKSEAKLYENFSTLSDDWMVFHSVRWQSKRNGKQGDGETDFILLHKSYGLLIVEVKGGSIDIRDGVWYSTGDEGQGSTTDPFEQARLSKYSLIKFLKDLGLNYVPINYAVAFTNETGNSQIGTYGPPEIIWYRNNLKDINQCIKTTHLHWEAKCDLKIGEVFALKNLLAPTIKVKKKVVDAIEDVNEELIKLTDGQIQAFSAIKKNRRAHVIGGAGTGKTILACERVRQLTRDGFKTLFVCYNDLLAKHLNENLECSDILTYHSFCFKEIRKAGLEIPQAPTQDWWENKASDLMVEAAALNNTSYDAIVIDEAQDFSQVWLDSLFVLITDTLDPPIYLFCDNRQDLYKRAYSLADDFISYELEVNCRNTLDIAERVSGLFKEKPHSLGVRGPRPIFSEVNVKREGRECVQSLVTRLIEDDLVDPSQICVLSDDVDFLNSLKEMYAGDVPFTKWGGKGIVCESVKRFKGLENDIVIVAIARALNFDKDLEGYYVAFSRPKSHLFVLGNNDLKKYLAWQ